MRFHQNLSLSEDCDSDTFVNFCLEVESVIDGQIVTVGRALFDRNASFEALPQP